jgi:hypothetical protein
MKKLFEFTDEDRVHIAAIKDCYRLRFDVDAIMLALQMLAEQPATPFEALVDEELLQLHAKAEARQRYATEQRTDAVYTAPHSASDMFEEMGPYPPIMGLYGVLW